MMLFDKVTGSFDLQLSITEIIVLLVVVVALIAVLAARGGPRVTQIDRIIEKDKDHGDA